MFMDWGGGGRDVAGSVDGGSGGASNVPFPDGSIFG